ncbi:uncharacterized protein LOC142985451 [Anticarsia gemmatalis]|uniref:uncharacterized protein LOC142985451 n=1 Tax=Anticarsia gemmatalis TaxID=129554 RepID=UPI003F77691F
MGAKAPEKLKMRRPPLNCDICGRKFLNQTALTNHRKFLHKTHPAVMAVAQKKLSKPQGEDKPKRAAKSVVSKPSIAKKVVPVSAPKEEVKPVTKVVKTVSKVDKNVPNESKESGIRQPQFKCPKCDRIFSVYFSAFRHIQKHHCVDANDQPVAQNSPDLIKPLPTEQCVLCNNWISSSEVHTCKSISELTRDSYMCLGCQQTFNSLTLFEHHVKGLHADGIECFYFPNYAEYTNWKEDLQLAANTQFLMLQSSQKAKTTYHCSHQPSLDTEKTLLCPSSFTITEFNKGYQVFYYKEHFGHTFTDISKEKYEKYSIFHLLKDEERPKNEEFEALFIQFKDVMNNILDNAAKGDVSMLNNLLGKALDMTAVLNNTVDSNSTVERVNKSMTDDQISEVLFGEKTYTRKKTDVKRAVKKVKPMYSEDVKLEDDEISNKSFKSIEKSDKITPVVTLTSPSFNDTYKDFVDQTIKSTQTDSPSSPKRNSYKRKSIMKTKIGQFKTKPSLSPKEKDVPMKTLMFNIKPDVEYEVKEQENDCNILILKI